MDATRRNILKMFGITVAAVPVAAVPAIAENVAAEPPKRGPPRIRKPWLNPLEGFAPPDGVTYQWKRLFITQDEPASLNHIAAMAAAGWRPVPKGRHLSDDGSYWIECGGMVLMEKPTKDIPPPRAHPVPWEYGPRG